MPKKTYHGKATNRINARESILISVKENEHKLKEPKANGVCVNLKRQTEQLKKVYFVKKIEEPIQLTSIPYIVMLTTENNLGEFSEEFVSRTMLYSL
uniref:Uncharacterized protein n=1 Tax=Megaselia scalaris TaxID=36166 RepID=T1GZQ1_MEGSC